MAGSDDELARTAAPPSDNEGTRPEQPLERHPRGDELAHTQTSPSTGARPPATPVEATLGRYRIERTLGEGGMGVVHAAFDPDLERRVALKVLRVFDDTQARQRLLREARAMARLTHANVVTVHEVGSAGGRDYVAMELVDGQTLVDWVHARPAERDIVAAFIAAGRGLAAAHAAGLVHRDFKPHNVLRRRDGRIAVTDFGLARGVDAPGLALETTLDLKAPASATSTARSGSARPPTPGLLDHPEWGSLSGLTATGSVLGTPAYMAPEQWTAGTVGPPADQFAFCVALWEALSGERPFRGSTIEQLKAEVQRGPGKLDTSKLPRRLRAALCRGLDPDPAKRWPNMDALLAALVRSQRRPGVAVAVVAGAVVAAVALYFAFGRGGGAPAPVCEVRDPGAVWSPETRDALAATRADLAAAIDRDVVAWRAARDRACAGQRGMELACLDGVLARIEVVRGALAKAPGDITDTAIATLVDPAVCAAAQPPRLTLKSSAETVAALALFLDGKQHGTKLTDAELTAFAGRAGLDPCAHALALHALALVTTDQPRAKLALLDGVNAAEACGDDRLRAQLMLEEAPFEYEAPIVGAKGRAALEKAKLAVDRVAQPDLVAEIDQERANIAAQDGHWDEAFAAAAAAGRGFEARHRPRAQMGNAGFEMGLRFRRNAPGDMEAVRAAVAKWKPIAAQLHDDRRIAALEQSDAYARLFLGDDVGAHREIVRLWHPRKDPTLKTQAVDGIVVDEAGKPAAGVTVAAGTQLFIDSLGPLPFGASGDGDLRLATTDEHGKFAIPDAPMRGTIMAQVDPKRRALPAVLAPHVRLQLGPTRRLAGRVRLGTVSRTKTFVIASLRDERGGAYLAFGTIHPDDTFVIDGAPTVPIKIGVTSWNTRASANIVFAELPASTADKTDLVIDAPSTSRTLDVVVRSTVAQPFDTAQVFAVPGKLKLSGFAELTNHHELTGIQTQFATPIVGEAIPRRAIGKTRSGDVVAHFTDVRAGDITVCAIGINGDISDPKLSRQLQLHTKELQSKCEVVGAGDDVVVIETPPQKRFD